MLNFTLVIKFLFEKNFLPLAMRERLVYDWEVILERVTRSKTNSTSSSCLT